MRQTNPAIENWCDILSVCDRMARTGSGNDPYFLRKAYAVSLAALIKNGAEYSVDPKTSIVTVKIGYASYCATQSELTGYFKHPGKYFQSKPRSGALDLVNGFHAPATPAVYDEHMEEIADAVPAETEPRKEEPVQDPKTEDKKTVAKEPVMRPDDAVTAADEKEPEETFAPDNAPGTDDLNAEKEPVKKDVSDTDDIPDTFSDAVSSGSTDPDADEEETFGESDVLGIPDTPSVDNGVSADPEEETFGADDISDPSGVVLGEMGNGMAISGKTKILKELLDTPETDPASDEEDDDETFSFGEDQTETDPVSEAVTEDVASEQTAEDESDDQEEMFTFGPDDDTPASEDDGKTEETVTDEPADPVSDEDTSADFDFDIQFDIDPKPEAAKEPVLVPRTKPAAKKAIFGAKSERAGNLCRDMHELKIPGVSTAIRIYVYPVDGKCSGFLIASEAAGTYSVVYTEEEWTDIQAAGRTIGVRIRPTSGGFDSDIRQDIVGTTDVCTSDRCDLAYVDTFLQRNGNSNYVAVPLEKTNMGRSSVPVIGCLFAGSKIFALPTGSDGDIHFSASGKKYTIKGAWDGTEFKSQIVNA